MVVKQQLQFKSFVHLLRVKYHKLLVLMMALISKYYVWIRKVELITFQENNGIQSIPRQQSQQTLFLHIVTGYPGCLHNPHILGLSNLYTRAEREEILKTPSKVIEGFSVRPLLLSDSAYPMTLWQVKPFSFTLNLTEREKLFNKHLSSARVIVEQAFGVLKGCFRILLKRIDIGLENTVKTIITCCVLHNIRQLLHNIPQLY